METLWQHWLKKKEKDEHIPVDLIHNELGFKTGQNVSIDILDYRSRDYTIINVEEHVRKIGSETFISTDYLLEDGLRLRVCDFKTNASCWLLTLHDEFAFNDDFLMVVKDASQSQFSFDDEVISDYLPVGNLTKSVLVQIKNDLAESRSIQLWTFERTGKDEAGQEFKELLFVEQDEETGWFQLWRGFTVPIERVFVI